MKECITTLPITPFGKPGIGHMVAPFVCDVIGKRLGIKAVLSLNVNGVKLRSNIENHVSKFVNCTKKLNMLFDYTWRDDSEGVEFLIREFFNQLLFQEDILEDEVETMKCSCGAIECLANAENFSTRRKLYEVKNERTICKLCRGEVYRNKERVFLLRFPDTTSFLGQAYPSFCSEELRNMGEAFSGQKMLISRTRASAFSMNIKKREVFLDVDFVWQLFLPLLNRLGYNADIVVGSSKNLMACLFSVALNYLIDKKRTSVVIPPYLLAPQRKKLIGKKYDIKSLLDRNDSKTIRLLLSTAMNWNKKESILDFDLFDLIGKMAYRINSKSTRDPNIEESLEHFKGQKVKEALSAIRKSREAFFLDNLFGII